MNTLAYRDTEEETEKNESNPVCEDALFASEARYRRLFESAKDGILILEAESGKIIDVNPFLVDLLGYSKEKFIDKELWEIGFFRDIAANKDKFQELQKEKYVRYDDLPLETTDGRKINVEFVSNVYWSNNKKVIQCNIRDITERKGVEGALLESEIKYRAFFENSMDAILLTSPDGKTLSANHSACSMFGYSEDELIKLGRSGIVDETDPRLLVVLTERKLKGKAQGEVTLIRKDRTRFPADISSAIFKDQKGNDRTSMIIRDITKHKLAEEEIAILSQSLKSINECVSITDLNDNLLFVNESFLKTYGYDRKELIGKNITIIRSRNNEDDKVEEILPATISGEWQGELMNRRKDGSEFPIYLSTSIISDNDSKVLGLIGVAIDITERKRTEEALIKAKEKAEESDRLKSAFLANMSHEVRTPLNSIIGFSELLGDSDYDEEQKNKFIQHIITNGNSLLSIISDIMDISKMESGEFKIHKSQINVQTFIVNIKEQFAIQVEGKKLELKLSLPINGERTTIYADNDRLKQIFNNLISNAIKFTKTGSIEIGYTLKSANPNMVSEPAKLEFFVKDTGIGIPAEYHNQIFERFMQVETSYTRNFGGVGLGLPISKKLIELMGGEIWFESYTENQQESKGSKFYFTVYSEKNK